MMSVWEQALVAIAIVAVLLFFGPSAKKTMEESRKAENPDWKGVLLPIGLVVLFVILLISMARG
jgi:multisubunit Na+/H+ antiporter MnhB subunit